jgi:Zn-dependent protease
MPNKKDNLHQAGRLLYSVFIKFVDVEAVFHKGEDLIFKVTYKSSGENWKEALRKETLEIGFYINFFENPDSLIIVAKDIRPQKRNVPWLNILLFVATLLSMISAYSFMEHGSAFFRDFSLITDGLYFALALMPILLCHEFGHYLAARRNKARVSLPYFIPAPTLIGTLGAIIKSKSPFKNRRELFDVGAAGPLAGFVPAIIILIIGFANCPLIQISEIDQDATYFYLGESIIFQILSVLFTPPVQEGFQMGLSPVIFAGWVGLFVTMINLIPVGQLDGGHIIYALFGKRVQLYLAIAFSAALVVLGFWWPGWFLWVFLAVVIIKLKHPPTLDDKIKLNTGRIILGWISIILFILTFMPVPLGFIEY